jgi:cell division protein FtsQ
VAQRSPKIGSLPWEEETSADSRFRRVQQVSPRTGRTLPGMPMEMGDPDEDEELPRRRRGYDAPRGPWYRPAGKVGRVLLASGALLIIGAVTTGVLMVKNALERDGRFRIAGTEDIQATGLSQVSRGDILPVFGEDIGKNIFFIHLSERRKQLEQIPWIERATVMRILPDHLRVSVVERTPVAFVRVGQQIELVDGNGVLLAMSPEALTQHHYSFPVVTGIEPRAPLAARKARMAVYQRLISDLDSSGQHLSQQISEIDLTDPEDARVLMPEQGADILAHFGDEQFLERYQRYKAHIADWRQQYPRLAAVDLRYDTQVVLKMAPGSGSAPTTVSAEDGKPLATADAAHEAKSATNGKPLPGTPENAGATSATKTPGSVHTAKSEHTAKAAHKVAPHHATRAATKSAAQREKEKREAARRAALLRRQRLSYSGNSSTANRRGQ